MNSYEKAYKKRTVYLSGKVTGLWRPWVVIKFLFWDLFYTGMGYEVNNPVKFINKSVREWFSEDRILTICIGVLERSDFIFMLPGWRKSKGAKIEFKKAAELGLTCLNSDWPGWNTYKEFEFRKVMFDCERSTMGELVDDMVDGWYINEKEE